LSFETASPSCSVQGEGVLGSGVRGYPAGENDRPHSLATVVGRTHGGTGLGRRRRQGSHEVPRRGTNRAQKRPLRPGAVPHVRSRRR
jgi:hypothetical protein